MADDTNEDAFEEEETQLEAAADALEAEQNEQPGWWRWRKAAALVTFGKTADEPPPPPPEPISSVRGTKPNFWKLAKHAQRIKSIPPSPKKTTYLPLAQEQQKDPEDPTRIYWDMTFVFPVKKEKKDAEEPKSDFQQALGDMKAAVKKRRAALRAIFDRVDVSGDGQISASELGSAFEAMGKKLTSAELNTMLQKVDTDGSGEISYSEYLEDLLPGRKHKKRRRQVRRST